MCDDAYVGSIHPIDANKKNILQLSTSGCGATALVNVIAIFNGFTESTARSLILKRCILRTRDNDAPLSKYLFSRSIAGCTGFELTLSMNYITEDNSLPHIRSEFVSYHEIISNYTGIFTFLEDKLKIGCVLIGTFNLQILGNDAWHHQLLYGINKNDKIAFCFNPVCEYSEDLIRLFISTQSELIIRREDILQRINRHDENDDKYNDELWRPYRIKLQIQEMLNNP